MKRVNLSVGQRLGIGFGTAGVLLVALVGLSFVWLGEISELRQRQAAVVNPRAVAADALESAILYMGLATRTYAMTGEPDHLQRYEQSVREVHTALERLAALPEDPDAVEAFARFPALLDQYEVISRKLVDEVRGAKDPARLPAIEVEVTTSREGLVALLHQFAALQRQKVVEARNGIAAAQEKMESALVGLGALVLLLLALTAWLTARGVRTPTLALVSAARRLAAGDFEPAVALAADAGPKGADLRDELAELSRSFGKMGLDLRAREERLHANARLAAALAASFEASLLCREGLSEIAAHLGAEVGAVYLAGEGGRLTRRAALGLSGEQELAPGEGIPGRAAQSAAPVVVRDIPADSPFTVRLGIDELPPRMVAAVPMLVQGGQVAGVVLLASLRELSADALAFVESAARLLGVSVQNALGHARLEELFQELQRKNEELQSQHEEIQAQNEELQTQQEELQAQNEELEAQSQKLREVVEALTDKEEALRDADRRRTEFLAVLSHELRNPLAPIRNSLYVLDHAKPGSPQAERAQEIIGRQVDHLARLVDDLLDVTRIDRGKIRLQRSVVDLGELVCHAAEDNESILQTRGVQFTLAVPPRPIYVDADPERLLQVIGNLLQNAAKFTPAGGRVELVLDAGRDHRAVIRVKDTGTGIEETVLQHLFQPFIQADDSLARTTGGLGLGLSLVKGLVELHGGTVRATSDGPGKGAEFTVELPQNGEPAPAPPPSPLAKSRPRRVLIVEDNADVADSLREVLDLNGHAVEVAYSGRDGIEKARAWSPDVLLCDIGLPDMDGYEVARAFRRDDALKGVFLVALTGYALPEDLKRAADAGFDEHMSKPPSIDKVEELLSRAAVSPRPS